MATKGPPHGIASSPLPTVKHQAYGSQFKFLTTFSQRFVELEDMMLQTILI
jgi:hypothetical protein